ncbi:MAG TPA: DUF1822 family protein [Coleofasciculaceae cyanobacterium]
MNDTQIPHVMIPLGNEPHRFAQQFAAQQATPQKGKRVYLNTLAVYAVHSYLKWLQIETNLIESDSWHSGKRAFFDVADLVLPNIGKLECRPVLPGEIACPLPPEVTDDRIGYVGVQFNESLSEVQLLGFAPAVDPDNPPEELKVTEFQSLDALIDCIYQLKGVIDRTFSKQVIATDAVSPQKTTVNLNRWLTNIFEEGWQSLDSLFGQGNIAWNFRSAIQIADKTTEHPETIIKGVKLIDLGIQLASHPVALVVTLVPETDQKINIILQVHPISQIYLPHYTRLTVFDESGATFLEAQARSTDNFIQLQFSGVPGEHFSVEVALGVASITEEFAI